MQSSSFPSLSLSLSLSLSHSLTDMSSLGGQPISYLIPSVSFSPMHMEIGTHLKVGFCDQTRIKEKWQVVFLLSLIKQDRIRLVSRPAKGV
jgi:hypothetical protein